MQTIYHTPFHVFSSSSKRRSFNKGQSAAIGIGYLVTACGGTCIIVTAIYCCIKRCQCCCKESRYYDDILRLQEFQQRTTNAHVNPYTNTNTQQRTFANELAFITTPSQMTLTESATTLTTQQMNLHTVPHRHTDICNNSSRPSDPNSEGQQVSQINSHESPQVNYDAPPPSYESVMNAEVKGVRL